MMAKMLDIPAVLLRTDFRSAGDQAGDGQANQWNLMCSGYPRSEVVIVHGMSNYQQEFAVPGAIEDRIRRVADSVAIKVIESLDVVRKKPSIYTESELELAYSLALRFPGSGFSDLFGDVTALKIIEAKRKPNLS